MRSAMVVFDETLAKSAFHTITNALRRWGNLVLCALM
jgi:hypothetical protein